MATMATLNSKCLSLSSPRTHPNPSKPSAMRPTLSLKGLSLSKPCRAASPAPFPSPALLSAGAIFSVLSASDAAFAAQQIADIAEGDNRGLALLIPLIPAILWVLYNILQPALNQLNRMRSEKAVVAGLGIGGGLAAAGLVAPDSVLAANELAAVADASSDSRGLLLLFVVAPAILWVLYNILQPALNQINRMRSG